MVLQFSPVLVRVVQEVYGRSGFLTNSRASCTFSSTAVVSFDVTTFRCHRVNSKSRTSRPSRTAVASFSITRCGETLLTRMRSYHLVT